MHDAHAIGRRAGDSRLLEHDAELDAIEGALRAAVEGRGRMVVVAGPGGIGKSQLLQSAREHAARTDATTLSARCSELERSFPFGAVFVSEKTVETHLARIFRKLAIRSRRELSDVLGRRESP